MFFIKRQHFNKTNIIKGLCTALLFSGPIFLSYFDYEIKLLNTLLVLFSFYLILNINRNALFYSGFFIGTFWFYWVSLSLRYYDLIYLLPFVILVFSLSYGFLFLLTAIKDNLFLRGFLFFLLTFLNPLGFNWFKPEILLLDSYFEANKYILAFLLLSTIFLIKKRFLIYTICIILISFININPNKTDSNNLKISLPEYHFEQDYKWDRKNLAEIIDKNFEQINKAILSKYDIVVLPETTFPFVLNKQNFVFQNLIEKSRYITIIAGGLFAQNGEYRNSSYIFKNGQVTLAHKVVLVPFGEEIPFPNFIKDFINNIFYNGAKDYKKAEKPTDFTIKNTIFRNAICYEASSEEIYEDLGDVKNIIAISNNAWFTPSIEPVLQKLLLRLYSKKYGVTIFHQINGSENYIIRPN